MSYTSRLSLLFVFLWSTAYIAFEFCSAYAEPATFTLLRVVLVSIVLFLLLVFTKTRWPASWLAVFHSAVVGILIHGIYAGGSFASVYHGMDIGYCALILSLQPLLTVLLSCGFLGERITTRKLIGIAAGSTGVALLVLQGSPVEPHDVVQHAQANANENSFEAVCLSVVALVAFSVATIYQKRFCGNTPMVSGAFVQYSAAAVFLLPIVLIFESLNIEWNIYFGFGLGWLVLVISTGAMFLLMSLIKSEEAGSVANLFYLVTPLVAIEAWILFDESLSPLSIAGVLLCTAGVAVVNYSGSLGFFTRIASVSRIESRV